eukprot:2172551-Pyramimonas_sp.AAC.1
MSRGIHLPTKSAREETESRKHSRNALQGNGLQGVWIHPLNHHTSHAGNGVGRADGGALPQGRP